VIDAIARLAVAAGAIVAMAARAHASDELAWDRLEATAAPTLEDDSIHAWYHATNRGDSVIRLSPARVACACVHVAVDKPELRPGETAAVFVDMTLGSLSGDVRKTAVIPFIPDGSERERTDTLVLAATVPPLARYSARKLEWRRSAASQAQTIIVTPANDEIVAVAASTPDDQFSVVTERVSDHYNVMATPKSTAKAVTSTISIEFTLKSGAKRTQTVFCTVR
jgi:hypothetical protein